MCWILTSSRICYERNQKSCTPQKKLCRFQIVQNVQKLDPQGRIFLGRSELSWSAMSCHHDMPTQLADLVPWVMIVCVCLCVFPTGLSEVLPRLYVFRPSLFLCNVKCSELTCTLSLGAPWHAQPPFLSVFHVLSSLPVLSLFAPRSHSFLHVCICGPMLACMYDPSDPCSECHALNSAALA